MMRPLLRVALAWFIAAAPGNAQTTDALIHEAVVEANVHDVWAAFATGEGLRSWMAPHAEIDLRIGGLMRSNYNAKGTLGDPSTIENRVLAFEPGRMLAMQVAKTPAGFPFPTAIYRMWTVIYFDAVAPGSTRVRSVSLGFTATDESQKMRAFFDQGNAATLKSLQGRFARR
jgi:uncharacterized protein YndB with AHSA1/START domain